MILENVALAVILATLLITKLVESTGDKGTKPLVASSTLQQIRDDLDSINESEEVGQALHKSSTEQGTPSVPVEVDNPIAKSRERQSFIEAVQRGDMRTAMNAFNDGSDELKGYYGEYLVNIEVSKLIRVIEAADSQTTLWILQVIFVHANQQLVDKVLAKLNLTNYFLKNVAGWCIFGLHTSKFHASYWEN